MVGGYAGRYLEVDLTQGSATTVPTDMAVAKSLIGGLNYAVHLLWQRTRPGIDPLSPENLLVFATGPITGLPGTERGSVVYKSPLTGLIGHAEVGGHWCSELKFAGYDGIVVKGKAEEPAYLYIKDDAVEVRSAAHLWGKTTSQTEQAVVKDAGDPFARVLCIGPAGENLSREACVVHTSWHAAARTGSGCVMGSKKLKAVAIRGTKGFPRMEDPDKCFELIDGVIANARSEELMHEGHYRLTKMGSQASQVERADEARGIFKNFDEGDHPDVVNIGGPRQLRRNRVRDDACFMCPVGCMHSSVVRSGVFAGTWGQPDWDSTANLTQQCLVLDMDGLIYLNALCDEYGIDAEGVGNTVAWAMECYERGVLTKSDLDGLELVWGDVSAEAKLIWKIIHREGVGNLLADGFKHFLPRVGKGSEKFAMQSKGCGFGGYQPWSYRETYAINNVGGHHNVDSPRSNLADSMTYCLFLGALRPRGFREGLEYYGALFNAATGWEFKYPEGFDLIGRRGVLLGRVYNIREGYGGVMPPSEADVYPEKAHSRVLTYGTAKGKAYPREVFLADRANYYKSMGCDERGVPLRETLKSLGLDFAIRDLEKVGAWDQ